MEANQIYLIETKINTGMLKARIGLVPYGPEIKNAEKFKERLLGRITKRDEIRIGANSAQTEIEDNLKAIVEKGLADYQKLKDKGKKGDVLTPDMHI